MYFSKCFCVSRIYVLVSILYYSEANYQIPKVTLKAFRRIGFQAAIVADNDTEIFGFHGAKNRNLNLIESGDFGEDIKEAKNGYLTYSNPNLELKIGDTVHYWVYVQHSNFGYRKDGLDWKVEVLEGRPPDFECGISKIKMSHREKVCSKSIVFEDKFDGDTLDTSKWISEQYIPGEPDFEFVIYKDDRSVTYLKNGHLFISPRLRSESDVMKQSLDLSQGCTRKPSSGQCYSPEKYLIQNPILSGRIVTKLNIVYGDVEIRAKLPVGDWIYPEIYLEDNNNKRIVIAYARGNRILKGHEEEVGGSLLFGGPMLSHKEPERSSKLSSTRSSSGLYSDAFHTYRLRWSEDKIELYVDGENYGDISVESISSSDFPGNANQVHLVLGVGVGGSSDFPDGYLSGDTPKPWRGLQAKRVKLFYDNRAKWLPTWTDAELAVDYVKITAIRCREVSHVTYCI